MARVFTRDDAKLLARPGGTSLEYVSGEPGSAAVSLRLVEIPVPQPGEPPRGPHVHRGFEECIYVLSGEGTTFADSGQYPLKKGDAILLPPGEAHVTRNTGREPLVLLCFFPTADVASGTEDVKQA